MHNFTRALKVALAHRINVAACVFTSAIIAVLWSTNLTAVFPVVEVIMNDHALPDWIDQKISESDAEIADSQRWLARLEEIGAINADGIKQRINEEIDKRKGELKEHDAKKVGDLDDVQIAEKTRLKNDIKRLKNLASL